MPARGGFLRTSQPALSGSFLFPRLDRAGQNHIAGLPAGELGQALLFPDCPARGGACSSSLAGFLLLPMVFLAWGLPCSRQIGLLAVPAPHG